MGAIDIRIRQDADFAITQSCQIRLIIGAMWVNSNGNRNIMDFLIGKQPVAVGFPGIQDFAPQWQYGLIFFIPPHFGRAARRVSFHQEQLIAGDVMGFAVSQLARQYSH